MNIEDIKNKIELQTKDTFVNENFDFKSYLLSNIAYKVSILVYKDKYAFTMKITLLDDDSIGFHYKIYKNELNIKHLDYIANIINKRLSKQILERKIVKEYENLFKMGGI